MTILLAGLELDAVAVMSARDERRLVAHHIPGLAGDVLQDIGRGPTRIEIDGVLHGGDARQHAEALGAQFRAGIPVELVAPLANSLEVQQVIIQRLELQDLASWPTIVQLRATLIEYTPPPAVTRDLGAGPLVGALPGAELPDSVSQWTGDVEEQLTVEGFVTRIMSNPRASADILAEAEAHAGDIVSQVEQTVGGRLASATDKLGGFIDDLPDEAWQLIGAAAQALMTGDGSALKDAFIDLGTSQLGALMEQIPGTELGRVLQVVAPDLTPEKLGEVIKTIAEDPSRLGPALQELATSSGGMAAMVEAAYRDPSTIPALLGELPELLEQMGMDELAENLSNGIERIKGSDFAQMVAQISELDLRKAGELLDKLRDADSLEDVLRILLDEGAETLCALTDLEVFDTFVYMKHGLEFLARLREVIEQGQELVQAVAALDLQSAMKELLQEFE